jgi:mRNA interferase RelE/StbE
MTEPLLWRLEVSARARRDLDRLPPRIASAVVEFATRTLPESPERLSRPLTGELEGLRSARRGDYRVIFELQGNERIILLVRIGHRAHIYRPE